MRIALSRRHTTGDCSSRRWWLAPLTAAARLLAPTTTTTRPRAWGNRHRPARACSDAGRRLRQRIFAESWRFGRCRTKRTGQALSLGGCAPKRPARAHTASDYWHAQRSLDAVLGRLAGGLSSQRRVAGRKSGANKWPGQRREACQRSMAATRGGSSGWAGGWHGGEGCKRKLLESLGWIVERGSDGQPQDRRENSGQQAARSRDAVESVDMRWANSIRGAVPAPAIGQPCISGPERHGKDGRAHWGPALEDCTLDPQPAIRAPRRCQPD